jgi:two-component sensor histidine kinase
MTSAHKFFKEYRAGIFVTLGALWGYSLLLWFRQIFSSLSQVDDLAFPLVAIWVCVLLFQVAWQTPSSKRQERMAWFFIAIAHSSYMLGDAIWAFLEIVLEQKPYPSIADALYLSFYPLLIGGLLLLPATKFSSGDRVKFFLDSGIVMLTATFAFVYFVFAPLLQENQSADGLAQILAIVYPVMDLALVFALGQFLFFRIHAVNQAALLFLAAGAVMRVGADLLYVILLLHNAYAPGGFADWLWLISLLLTAWAGLVKLNQINTSQVGNILAGDTRLNSMGWVTYLPYGLIVGVVILLLLDLGNRLDDSTVQTTWMVLSIMGMIFVRQILTLRENTNLYHMAKRDLVEREGTQLHLTRHLVETEAIYRLADAVSKASRVEEIYPLVLDTLQIALRVDCGAIALFDADGVIRFQASRGLSYELQILLTGYSPWTFAERHARPMPIDQVENDKRLGLYGKMIMAQNIRSIAYVPLAYGKQLLGQFLIGSVQSRKWDDNEMHLAQTIAGHVTFAMERMCAEEKTRASLAEKEILLKEIHHRVKNNLQIVSSLLSLQSRQVQDARIFEALCDSQNRVRSMSLIHEKLYQSHDLARIDLADYIRGLTTHLYHSYGAGAKGIMLEIEAAPVVLNVDTAIPCGLILNELVSNALKHGFPEGTVGKIEIELTEGKNNQIKLKVSDNGVGMVPECDWQNSSSLGLQLVNTLVSQINGRLELEPTQGTCWQISFAAVK